jgi:ADP-ribosylglycohydrolase
MCGGGSLDREPGKFTDDTQMALLVASSLLDRDGLDEADLFGESARPRRHHEGGVMGADSHSMALV